MTEELKPDYVMSDGKQIFFDLSQCTHKQWRGIFDKSEDNTETDKTLARVYGMTLDEIENIPEIDYRRLFILIVKRITQPLSDPNA